MLRKVAFVLLLAAFFLMVQCQVCQSLPVSEKHMSVKVNGVQGGGDVGETFTILTRRLQNINCGSSCNYRCSKADAQDRCLKYCNICCAKCNCVPPGTYGNKEQCPCYNNLKNSKGGSKCP